MSELSPLMKLVAEAGIDPSQVEGLEAEAAPEAPAPKVWTVADRAAARAGLGLELNLIEGQRVELNALLAAALPDDVALPEAFPSLVFDQIQLTIKPSEGSFRFEGRSTLRHALPWGEGLLAAHAATLTLARQVPEAEDGAPPAGPRWSVAVALSSEVPLELAPGLRLLGLNLSLSLREGGDWALGGGLQLGLFDEEIALAASLGREDGAVTVELEATRTATAPLLSLGEVLRLDARAIRLRVSRAPAAQGAAPWTMSLRAEGGVELRMDEARVGVDGALTLARLEGATALAFVSTAPMFDLPLRVPQHELRVRAGLRQLVVQRTEATANAPAGWSLAGAAAVQLSGLPAPVASALAEELVGRLVARQGYVELSIERLFNPIRVPLKRAELAGATIDLGEAAVDASRLAIRLTDDDVALSVDLGVGLPARLNALFGTDADGAPVLPLLRTWDPARPDESALRLRVALGRTGLTLTPMTSPVQFLTLTEADGAAWAEVDLGAAGALRCQVPTLSFDGYTFSAQGALQITRPLALPLSLVRTLLVRQGRQDLADALPERLPLVDLNVVDATGALRLEPFLAALERSAGAPLPGSVRAMLEGLQGRINLLPEDFLRYLRFVVPEALRFDLAITTDGGARVQIAAPGDTPLRFLAPSGAAVPALQGVELRSLTFGEVAAGSALLLTADVRIDHFDLLTMFTALLPATALQGLPDPRQTRRRLTVQNLVVFILYQGGIPVPIPVFYDELGLELRGLEGAHLESRWHFPTPRLDLAEALRKLASLVRFVRDPQALLDPGLDEAGADPARGGVDLRYTVGTNYLTLPPWLGEGAELGSRGPILTVSAWATLAAALNAVKTGDAGGLLQLLPLQSRVREVALTVFGLRVAGGWILCSPAEFRAGATERLGVAQGEVEPALAVVPREPGAREPGVISLVAGQMALDDRLALEARVGFAASRGGMGTGLALRGRVAGLVDLHATGQIVVNTDPGVSSGLLLAGSAGLSVLGQEILSGRLKQLPGGLEIRGRLNLFPRVSGLDVVGEVVGRVEPGGFSLRGDVEASLAGAWSLGGASLHLSNAGMRLDGRWLDQQLSFEVQRHGDGLALQAALSPFQVGTIVQIAGSYGNAGPIARLELTDRGPQLFLDAAIGLPGLSVWGRVYIGASGYALWSSAQLYGLFSAHFVARGPRLDRLEGALVELTLGQEFGAFLATHGATGIQAVANASEQAIRDADRAVAAAQRDVDSLLAEVERQRAIVGQERQNAAANLEAAMTEVRRWEHEVARLNAQIEQTRAAVRAEREADLARLHAARAEVERAQHEVNRLNGEVEAARQQVQSERDVAQAALVQLQGDVDRAQGEVNRIQGEIDSTNAWYYSLPVAAWPWEASQIREAAWFGATQGARYTALGVATGVLQGFRAALDAARGGLALTPVDLDPRVSAMLAAHGAATAALQVATQTLAGLAHIGEQINPDADPRVWSLLGARDGALASLSVAQAALTAAQQLVVHTPIDLDPRVSAPLAAHATATAALSAASLTLAETQRTLATGAAVASWLHQHGPAAALAVRRATATASLDALAGRVVGLQLELDVLGQPRKLDWSFNFADPYASAVSLGRAVVGS